MHLQFNISIKMEMLIRRRAATGLDVIICSLLLSPYEPVLSAMEQMRGMSTSDRLIATSVRTSAHSLVLVLPWALYPDDGLGRHQSHTRDDESYFGILTGLVWYKYQWISIVYHH
jgi:hypothetical protein